MQTEFKEMKEERTQMSNYVTFIVIIALYFVFTMGFNKLVEYLVFTFFRGGAGISMSSTSSSSGNNLSDIKANNNNEFV